MLTKRALLNSLQMFVDQLARILVGFILTPILVSHLGSVLFGVWQVLQRASLQVAALDGRAPEVLKWVIASQQDHDDDAKKQRAVGSAVISFLAFLPLLLLVYVLLIVFLPQYLDLDAGQVWNARIAVAVLGLGAILLVAADLFEASIRGMNIAYKLLGVQAAVLIAGGVMTAVAAIGGYGLLGLAIAQVAVAVLFIFSYFMVARRNVPWLGIGKPSGSEIWQALNRSKWYTLWAFISAWLFAGDVIVLGAFVAPQVVSKYVLTMYVSQMITVAILTAVSSALPGLAGIIGKGEYQRAEVLRQESLLYSWWLSITICSAVIVFNHSFISLWVGAQQYAGHDVNALIAVCVMQLVFIRHDANILNLALDVKKKVVLGFASASVTLVLSLILVPMYQLYGLCFSLLLGRALLSVLYPRIIGDFLKAEKKPGASVRRLMVTALLLLITWALSAHVFVTSWWLLAGGAALFAGLALPLIYAVGMNAAEKQMVIKRYRMLKPLQP